MTVRRMNDSMWLTNSITAGVAQIKGTNVNTLWANTAPVQGIGYGYYIPFAMQFSLNQIAGVAELADIFDQYRLLGVKVFISYQHNVSTAGGTSGLPAIQWFPDFDDATPPATESDLRQRMGVITRRWDSDSVTQVMSVRPRPIYTAGTAMVPYGTWFDCQTNPNTVHYGLKGILSNVLLPAATGEYDPRSTAFKIDVQYVIQFRGLT